MKAYKTTLFIFCVLGMLSLICWLWPKEPVTLTLNWPSMKIVLQTDDPSAGAPMLADADVAGEEQPTPEETVATDSIAAPQQPAAEMKADENIEIAAVEVSDTTAVSDLPVLLADDLDPAGIFFPRNDATYLDNFFRSLENSQNKHVRIIHYGDSQIEEDRISAKLRNNLQDQFGGWGTGLQPAMRRYVKPTLRQSTSPELQYSLLFGKDNFKAKDNFYGPMTQVTRVNGKATVDIKPSRITNYPHSRRFDHLGVLVDGKGSIEIVTSDSTYAVCPKDTLIETMQQFYVDLPVPVTEAKFVFKGKWNVYGLMLDGKNGITVDNIPMRGYSGTTFKRNKIESMTPFYDHQNVGLIIFQFGGNSVPVLKSDKSIAEYKRKIGESINYFHKLAPNASILMIGPADMSTIIGGRRQTYPQLPKVIKALKEAALENNAAYWSMYDVMGGWGSMIQYVKARPQLAGEDYIHFTRKGADKMADRLNELIMEHYNAYRKRNGLAPIE